jgi:hypothetical protein
MRSPRELLFRLRQEAQNFRLFLLPPQLAQIPQHSKPPLPDVDPVVALLRETAFAQQVEHLADGILQHRIPLLGLGEIQFEPQIAWRRDFLKNIESGLAYFRRIPYLDATAVGDHKVIWELNRHQHLVTLAQAYRFTQRSDFRAEIEHQIDHWIACNPFQRGINWTSALEVAFRALSWLWVDHLCGAQLNPAFRHRLLTGLYQHALHLEQNLSVYFSPNTHLLGEAVALHAIGSLYPWMPGASRWTRDAGRIVEAEMFHQVRPDGSHFEQSSYYQVYALDMFLFTLLIQGNVLRKAHSAEYVARLHAMADYLRALIGPSRTLPFLGDDDGGRMFHPFGARDQFARETLATCAVALNRPDLLADTSDLHEQAAWWIGAPALTAKPAWRDPVSQQFPDSGLCVTVRDRVHILYDGGPFGFGTAGHSHSDSLSIVARAGDLDVLIDPGTFTYVGDPQWREWFRGSAAHNTVRIDQLNQAPIRNMFAWNGKPAVTLEAFRSNAAGDFFAATCEYSGFRHHRQAALRNHALFVVDWIEAIEIETGSANPSASHLIQQFWHLGPDAASRLHLPPGSNARLEHGGQHGWRSRVLGSKEEADVCIVELTAALPCCLGAVIDLSEQAQPAAPLHFEAHDDEATLEWHGARVTFSRRSFAGS